MAVNTGEGSKLQIGLGSVWGTITAPTVEVDMLNEKFGEEYTVITEDSLVGKATQGRSDVMGKKVTGGFEQLVKPDNIGLLLACALGSEAAPAQIGGTAVYDHSFSLITGSANLLPIFDAVVDKRTSVYGFISNKVSSISLNQANNDYLKASIDSVGFAEAADALEDLTLSTLRSFNFNDLTVEFAGTPVGADVKSVSFTLNNSLEDDEYVADGSTTMAEIDRQRREPTIEIEINWTAAMEAYRTANYKTATPLKVELIWTGATIATTDHYTLTVTAENAFITSFPDEISGAERITTTISFRCGSIGSAEPLVVTLRDLTTTRYLG